MSNGIEPNSIPLSKDATAIVDHIKTHYKQLGKTMASQNYGRHVKRFFEWAESNGLSVNNLPADAPEQFLRSLNHKPTTEYVVRTQLKSALKEAHLGLGANFGHLEYEANKAPEVIRAQVERAKERNKEKKMREKAIEMGVDPEKVPALKVRKEQIRQRAAEVHAETVSRKAETVSVESSLNDFGNAPDWESHMSAPEVPTEVTPVVPTQVPVQMAAAVPQQTVVSGQNGQAPTFIIQTTPTGVSPSGRPTNTIANAANGVNPAARGPVSSAPTSRSVLINTQTFSGPHIKINRIADGSEPLIPPGTETFVTTLPTAQIAPHGDVASFLQNYLIPSMRLSPMVSQVHFVFHELNDKRTPTGRRDELIVAVPSMGGYSNGYGQQFGGNGGQQFGGGYGFNAPPQQQQQAPVVVQLEQPSITGMSTPVAHAPKVDDKFDRATEILLKKLDREADEARQRAIDLEKKLMESRDTQTTFLLMQQMQKENDMRQKLEEQRREATMVQEKAQEEERRRQEREDMRRMMEMQMQNNRSSYEPPPWAMAPPPPPPQPIEIAPRVDASAEMAKAFAESQAKMMEAMMNGLAAARNVPPPPPAPPQKDVAEWMVPMMTQMAQMQQQQQQMQAQMAQAQQQMMMQVQAENMKMMIAMQQTQAQAAQASSDKMLQIVLAGNSKEDAETAVLREQLRQAHQQISGLSQRGDEVEEFADKLAKMKQVSELVGGGGTTNFLSGIVENFGQIAQGAAHIMGAMNSQKAAAALPPAPAAALAAPVTPPQLAGVPAPAHVPPQASANAQPVGEVKPPDECIKAIEAVKETEDDEELVNTFVEFMKGLNTSPDKLFQVQLERILKVFQQCDDEEDVYTLCKQLWIVVGMKADKAGAKKLAAAITKWYPLIHKSFFGEARMLPNLEAPVAADVMAALQSGDLGPADTSDEEDGEEDEEDGDEE